MKILTWHDKHGDYHYSASTEAELHKSALDILNERIQYGYLDDEAEERAKEILSSEDGARAWEFLLDRSDYEYERVILEEIK